MDFKEMDNVRHKKLTGVSNDNIVQMANTFLTTEKICGSAMLVPSSPTRR